ncbi:unnamed protein product [Cuscuta europaea]|nr:unnamed protein product [Cuscuta europaea]
MAIARKLRECCRWISLNAPVVNNHRGALTTMKIDDGKRSLLFKFFQLLRVRVDKNINSSPFFIQSVLNEIVICRRNEFKLHLPSVC